MTTALATFSKHRNTFLIDVALLAALYFLPSLSHVTAVPLYMLEPMRIALIIALRHARHHFDQSIHIRFIAVAAEAGAHHAGHVGFVPFE